MATPYSDDTPKRKPKATPIPRIGGLTDADLSVNAGFGEIPLKGRFNQRLWANRWLGITEDRFRKDVKKYGIRFKRRGDDIYVDAEDFWAALPEGNTSEE